MDKSSLAAILALLGLDAKNPSHTPLMDFLGGRGAGFDTPDPSSMTQAAGSIVAAWYSIHTGSVDVCVVDPIGGTAQTRITHPALGPYPTINELWDYLYICLSGLSTRLARGHKIRGAEYAEVLCECRTVAESIARHSPFQAQPWHDTARIGKFTVTQMYAAKPSSLATHVLDVAYRHARHMSALRGDRIKVLSDTLSEKRIMFDTDFEAILGPRTFAISRRPGSR